MRRIKNRLLCSLIIVCVALSSLYGCAREESTQYGVYLSSEYDSLPKNISCQTLVIDAQYYTNEDITSLRERNEKIYSYINIGAVENFRDYYEEYQDIFLGEYENWPEENFVDVSLDKWQTFILEELAPAIQEKGVDGLFLDNIDVYYEYPSEEIFHGITEILKGLRETGLELIVNGGDVYVTEYMDRYDDLTGLIDGINQEGVFTSINWEDRTLGENDEENKQYFLDYIDRVRDKGGRIYLIEYTDDRGLEKSVKAQCEQMGFIVYVSDGIELD